MGYKLIECDCSNELFALITNANSKLTVARVFADDTGNQCDLKESLFSQDKIVVGSSNALSKGFDERNQTFWRRLCLPLCSQYSACIGR